MTAKTARWSAQQDETFENLRARFAGEIDEPWRTFGALTSRADLKRLPVQNWSIYAPFFEAFRRGERSTFGGDEVAAFAKSSASSGTPKLVPVTEPYLIGHRIFVMNMFMGFAVQGNFSYDELLDAKRLCLPNRACYEIVGGVPVGSVSGLLYVDGLEFGVRTFIPDRVTMELASWADKLPAIARQARDEDVRILSCLPDLGLHFLRYACQAYGVKDLGQVWPRLDLITVAGERLTPLHRATFHELLGRDARRPVRFCSIYTATEAQLAHSAELDADELVFPMDINVLMFLREADATQTQPELYLPEEVQAGEVYYPIVTTPGGLVQYPLWDRLRIQRREPFTAEILGRREEDISVFGEKISIASFQEAASQLDRAHGLGLQQWAVFPERLGEAPWHLVWTLAAPGLERLGEHERAELARECDEILRRLSGAYADLRDGHFYADPVLEIAPLAAFTRVLESKLDSVAQFKFRRLFASRAAYLASLSLA
jgi:hypothetical protein